MSPDASVVYIPNLPKHSMWEDAVVYQIYPRSFAEIRPPGEALRGEGSLMGITVHIPYLQRLKIDVIWLSPFYPSPMKDGGYDISDYCAVDERFGNLNDFDDLVAKADKADIKIMVDLVVNHTSDQHAWFQESRSSKDNPKSDWFIWRDPSEDGGVPNNWASVFSLPQLEKRKNGELDLPDHEWTPPVPAWTFDQQRGQYYLHSFAKEQPDLNWTNPVVRGAVKDVMRFWLDRGVAGFRVDAVNHIGKDPEMHNEGVNHNYHDGVNNPYDQLTRYYSAAFPDVYYDYLAEMIAVLHEPAYEQRDTRLIFEAYESPEVIYRMNDVDPSRASAFNFGRMRQAWEAPATRSSIHDYYKHIHYDAIPNNVNGNHDNTRIASRIGPSAARAAAVINAMLPGQMYIYNGEEIGMRDVVVPLEKRDDVYGLRDSARTPMQWSADANAGFSLADPADLWLPVSSSYAERNVTAQSRSAPSSLWLYRSLLMLRRSFPILKEGDYYPINTTLDDSVFAFARHRHNEYWLVVTNFSHSALTVGVPDFAERTAAVILSSLTNVTHHDLVIKLEQGIELKPLESIVLKITK